MKALGGARDYTTWDRTIKDRIKKHIELTKEYQEDGLSLDAASKKAYKEMTSWK